MSTLAKILDNLGVAYEPDDGELVVGALVLLKTIDSDGVVGLSLRSPDGSSWPERVGMLEAAKHIELNDLEGPL